MKLDNDNKLISIRPKFADAIFNGSKTVEIRRRIPQIKEGVRLWIYVTKPVAEVWGVAKLVRIIQGHPDEVWRSCGSRTGLSRSEFDQYLHGSERAYGLVLTQVELGLPASIDEMRALRAGFHPPQVIAALTATEAEGLRRHLFPSISDPLDHAKNAEGRWSISSATPPHANAADFRNA